MKAALYTSRLHRVYSAFSRERRCKGAVNTPGGVVTGAFPAHLLH